MLWAPRGEGDHHALATSQTRISALSTAVTMVQDGVLGYGSNFAAKSTGLNVLRTQPLP